MQLHYLDCQYLKKTMSPLFGLIVVEYPRGFSISIDRICGYLTTHDLKIIQNFKIYILHEIAHLISNNFVISTFFPIINKSSLIS